MESYKSLRDTFLNDLEIAKSDITYDSLKQAISSFLKLPALNDYPEPEYVDDKRIFTEELLGLIAKLNNEDERYDLYIYFAEEAIDKARKSEHHYDLAVAEQVIEAMPKGDEKDELEEELDVLKKNVFDKMIDDYIDWTNPPKNIKYDPYIPPDESKPTFEEAYGEPKNPTPPKPIANYDRAISNYVKEGNRCYKITEYYKDNKLINKKKELVSEAEKIFCGVQFSNDRFHSGHKHGHNHASTGGMFQRYVPYVSQSNPDTRTNTAKSKADQNKEQPITLHYSFDKYSESPYFYDTGIPVVGNAISYEQAKDALHQIAIHAKGKFAEDKDKALGLIDGVIVLLVNPGKPIPVQEFAALFKDTIVEVKALDTRSGMSLNLADLVESKEVQVYVDNKKINLSAPLIVDNSVVLFPIEQIAKALGGKVIHDKQKTTIVYKDKTLVYEDGNRLATINNETVDLGAEVRTNKDGIRMAPIKALVSMFGKAVEVDTKKAAIIIH